MQVFLHNNIFFFVIENRWLKTTVTVIISFHFSLVLVCAFVILIGSSFLFVFYFIVVLVSLVLQFKLIYSISITKATIILNI